MDGRMDERSAGRPVGGTVVNCSVGRSTSTGHGEVQGEEQVVWQPLRYQIATTAAAVVAAAVKRRRSVEHRRDRRAIRRRPRHAPRVVDKKALHPRLGRVAEHVGVGDRGDAVPACRCKAGPRGSGWERVLRQRPSLVCDLFCNVWRISSIVCKFGCTYAKTITQMTENATPKRNGAHAAAMLRRRRPWRSSHRIRHMTRSRMTVPTLHSAKIVPAVGGWRKPRTRPRCGATAKDAPLWPLCTGGRATGSSERASEVPNRRN